MINLRFVMTSFTKSLLIFEIKTSLMWVEGRKTPPLILKFFSFRQVYMTKVKGRAILLTVKDLCNVNTYKHKIFFKYQSLDLKGNSKNVEKNAKFAESTHFYVCYFLMSLKQWNMKNTWCKASKSTNLLFTACRVFPCFEGSRLLTIQDITCF